MTVNAAKNGSKFLADKLNTDGIMHLILVLANAKGQSTRAPHVGMSKSALDMGMSIGAVHIGMST